ncbi:MAG: FtsX-like permease family protein [Candidatus Bathyarchaeia archaeon]
MNAILPLIGYLTISISSQQKDFSIMRALGARPKTVIEVIVTQTFLLVLAGAIIGLPVGAIIILWFFIPDAVISQTAVLFIAALLSMLIGILCLSSLYPSIKIARMPVTDGVCQV